MAVVAKKGDGEGGSSGTDYSVDFTPSPPGIDVTVCGTGASITFNRQGFAATSTGAFDTVWSSLTPVLRAVGQVTPTSVQATLSCTNGVRSGTMSATGSGGAYNGTFSFGTSTGQVSIRRFN